MTRRILNGHRLSAARNKTDKPFIRGEARCGDRVSFQTFSSDQQQAAILQPQIDGADICNHCGGNQPYNLVEPRTCFAFLRHDLAEPVHQQSRGGQIIRHGQPVCRSLCQAASRPNAV